MEQQPLRGSGETDGLRLALIGGRYPSACTDLPDGGYPGVLGGPALQRLHDPRVEVEEQRESRVRNTKPHDQPARVGNDPCKIAWRAVDLLFPQEGSHDEMDDFITRQRIDDDGQVIDEDNETDRPDPCEIAWRALDLMFPQEDSDDYVDDWIPEELSNGDGQVIDEEEETNCPGKYYPVSEAEKWDNRWLVSYSKQYGDHSRICNEILARGDENARLPTCPLTLLPEVSGACVLRGYCYHRKYITHDTYTTESTLPYCIPKEMMQIFFLRLSRSESSYPISVYGIFAIRDDLDPRRNYVFNHLRDDAVTIQQEDSFTLPLCSPCRGMYVPDHALIEVDLWVKNEGEGSADKQLLSGYAEIHVGPNAEGLRVRRISNDNCNLDMGYMILIESFKAAIQVYAKVDHPHHVRFTAFSSGFQQEILLFDDKLHGKEKLFQHVVAVQANKKLDVLLKVQNSLFRWTFQDGSDGAVCSPDDSIFEYGQFFVRVLFSSEDLEE